MADFTKLSALVDDTFTVEEAYGYQFKKWDAEAKRMLTSEKWQEGFRKIYSLKTDKGTLDIGPGQLGSLLQEVYRKGVADINGVTFHVKSNGKTGMDIRYFFNVARDTAPAQVEEQGIDLEDIPF